LQRLVAEGALEVHANRRVSLPPMTLGRFDELTRIRVELEGLATECAVLHAAPKDLDRLARLNDELVILAHKKKLSDYLARNRQFHLLLYGLSDMQELLAIIDSLWLRIGPFLNHSRVALLAAHDSDDNILRNHALAIEALRRGDGPAARAAIGRDLTEAAAVIRTTLQARDTAVA
jgi:DNA-binding GntR family transcriptional regulator